MLVLLSPSLFTESRITSVFSFILKTEESKNITEASEFSKVLILSLDLSSMPFCAFAQLPSENTCTVPSSIDNIAPFADFPEEHPAIINRMHKEIIKINFFIFILALIRFILLSLIYFPLFEQQYKSYF